MTEHDGHPEEGWSLAQLGEYAQTQVRKTAIAAWRLGRALQLANDACKHGGWEEWCQHYVPHLSPSSILRYRRVSYLSLADVAGKSLAEVYSRLGIKGKGKTAAERGEGLTEISHTPTGKPTAKKSASHEAVSAEDDADHGPDDRAEVVPGLDAKVAEIVGHWPETVANVRVVCDSLADALDMRTLAPDEAVRVLVAQMHRPASTPKPKAKYGRVAV